MWNIQNGEEKKYPAVENCILAFCGVLCYTVNRCRFCKQGIARKITECSRPSTRKTKLKEKFNMKNKKALFITQGAVIAAIYVVLVVVFNYWSFGPIQFRIAEVLTILPYFTPAAIPGLFIGCIIANVMGGAVIWDIVFGSIATLIGAIGTYMLRKNKWLAPLPPVIANTLIVPFVLKYAYGAEELVPLLMVSIGASELVVCGVLGMLLLFALNKYRHIIFNN